jgi:hypothetical protein
VQVREIADGVSSTLLVGEFHTKTNAPAKAFWASTHSFQNLGAGQLESYTRLADYDACIVASGNRGAAGQFRSAELAGPGRICRGFRKKTRWPLAEGQRVQCGAGERRGRDRSA